MTDLPSADVVVVGAGLAGLVGALRCAENGLTVTLVEKRPAPGGSTAMSGGWFAFSDTPEQRAAGVRDGDAAFVDDMWVASGQLADRALLDAYVAGQRDAQDWLRGHGAVFDVLKLSAGQSVPRSHHAPVDDLLSTLTDAVRADPAITLVQGRAARSLVTDDDGHVRGVELETGVDTTVLMSTSGVLLTTGGFSRSTRLLGELVPAQLAAIPHGGPGNTGDGLAMARAVGAGLRDLEHVSGTYGSHPYTTDEEHELLTAFYLGAVIVNTDGQRFVDESATYKEIGARCLQQPHGLGFQVFDATVRARSQPGVPLSDIDHLEAKGHVHRADSLSELAAAADIDAEPLVATIEAYNAAVAGRAVDTMGRTSLCNGVGALEPIDAPPFYAYPAKTLMTSTYAGLTVTPHAEVTDVDGRPVPGLYAAGEVTGGFHGRSYVTGTALGKAAIFGLVAADAIAAKRASR